MIPPCAACVGKIHAASVSPVPAILRPGESAATASCVDPFSWIAPPIWPVVQLTALRSVALFPLPLLSAATAPPPSSNRHRAVRPATGGGEDALVVTGNGADSAELFAAASNADTV